MPEYVYQHTGEVFTSESPYLKQDFGKDYEDGLFQQDFKGATEELEAKEEKVKHDEELRQYFRKRRSLGL